MDTWFQRLKMIINALDEAAMTKPWDQYPYAVMRKMKAKSGDNLMPNPKALRLRQYGDELCKPIVLDLEEKSDGILLVTRKCIECGLMFKPEDDSVLCVLCEHGI